MSDTHTHTLRNGDIVTVGGVRKVGVFSHEGEFWSWRCVFKLYGYKDVWSAVFTQIFSSLLFIILTTDPARTSRRVPESPFTSPKPRVQSACICLRHLTHTTSSSSSSSTLNSCYNKDIWHSVCVCVMWRRPGSVIGRVWWPEVLSQLSLWRRCTAGYLRSKTHSSPAPPAGQEDIYTHQHNIISLSTQHTILWCLIDVLTVPAQTASSPSNPSVPRPSETAGIRSPALARAPCPQTADDTPPR